MSPQDARQLNVANGQKVSVRSDGERQLTFDEVVVRVREDFALEFHIDTEEANAAGEKRRAGHAHRLTEARHDQPTDGRPG